MYRVVVKVPLLERIERRTAIGDDSDGVAVTTETANFDGKLVATEETERRRSN